MQGQWKPEAVYLLETVGFEKGFPQSLQLSLKGHIGISQMRRGSKGASGRTLRHMQRGRRFRNIGTYEVVSFF